MRNFWIKLAPYIGGLFLSLKQLKLSSLLHAIADSDEIIKYIRPYNFSIVLNVNDRFIGRPILLKSSYEEHVTRVLLDHLKVDTCFLDIGANIGYYSLLVASQCPGGKVFSFEPDATNFRLLQTSIVYNGFEPIIQAHQLAVSDQEQTIILFDLKDSQNSGAKLTAKDQESLSPYTTKNSDFQTINAVRLDSFLPDVKIDLVKIDIEGHEPFAIQGMMNLLKQYRPVILVEFSPSSLSQIGKTSPQEFLTMFQDLDYSISVISRNGDLISCQDISAVIYWFEMQQTNHIDLLLKANIYAASPMPSSHSTPHTPHPA